MFEEKSEALFKEYYLKLLTHPAIERCQGGEGVTAAYLYTLTEISTSRNSSAEEVGSERFIYYLLREKVLSLADTELLQKSASLFEAVVRGDIQPRAEWCFYSAPTTNKYQKLFLCYGDLINADFYLEEYLANYQQAKAVAKGLLDQTAFEKSFRSVRGITEEYVKKVIMCN